MLLKPRKFVGLLTAGSTLHATASKQRRRYSNRGRVSVNKEETKKAPKKKKQTLNKQNNQSFDTWIKRQGRERSE